MSSRKVVLETSRLLMCRLRPGDMPLLSRIVQDDSVMYAYEGALSDPMMHDWMDRQLRHYEEWGFGQWGMWLKDSNEMIGLCGITMQEYENSVVPEIGYLLAHKWWHQGYAFEAARACREYGFKLLGFTSMYSIIREGNTSSERLAERNGMKPVGTKIIHYRGVDMNHTVFRVDCDFELK